MVQIRDHKVGFKNMPSFQIVDALREFSQETIVYLFVYNVLANTYSKTFKTHLISHISAVQYIISCDALSLLYKVISPQSIAFTVNVGVMIVDTHTVYGVDIDFTF